MKINETTTLEKNKCENKEAIENSRYDPKDNFDGQYKKLETLVGMCNIICPCIKYSWYHNDNYEYIQ